MEIRKSQGDSGRWPQPPLDARPGLVSAGEGIAKDTGKFQGHNTLSACKISSAKRGFLEYFIGYVYIFFLGYFT